MLDPDRLDFFCGEREKYIYIYALQERTSFEAKQLFLLSVGLAVSLKQNLT